MSGKTQQFLKDLRRTPLVGAVIPLEAGTGWPIPVRKGGRLYVTIPFFGCPAVADRNETPLYPPFATVTVDWANKVPVEYQNLRFRNPWPEGDWSSQVGTFPHMAVSQMKVSEYKAKREELLSMYDEMFEKLSSGGAFTSEWTARFTGLLRLLVEPSLEPYYRALGPKFFDRFLPTAAAAS